MKTKKIETSIGNVTVTDIAEGFSIYLDGSEVCRVYTGDDGKIYAKPFISIKSNQRSMEIERGPFSNRFCGPAAIASLAGIHVDKAVKLLQVGDNPVRETWGKEMVRALEDCKYICNKLNWIPMKRWSLGRVIEALRLAKLLRHNRFLVLVSKHWVAIGNDGMVYDNHNLTGVSVDNHYKRRAMVHSVYSVLEEGEEMIQEASPTKRKPSFGDPEKRAAMIERLKKAREARASKKVLAAGE